MSTRPPVAGRLRRLALCVVSAALGAVTPAWAQAPAPPSKLALTGARIIPVVGDDIDEGTILIEDGLIVAVGREVSIPYDAMEVDCTGLVLMPGMIDPDSFRGLDIPNENIPVVPFLDVYDAIDPSRLYFEDALRSGITTVHVMQGPNCAISAVSRVVRPIGLSVGEMTVAPEVALKLVTSPRSGADRMEQMFRLRDAFARMRYDFDTLAETKYEEAQKKASKPVDVAPAEARRRGADLVRETDLGDPIRNLIRLSRGSIIPFFHAVTATDLRNAVRLAEEEKILDRAVFIVGTDAYRAIAELTRVRRPVVIGPALVERRIDPDTEEIVETFLPAVLHAAGIPFAIRPDPDGSLAERYLTYQAAVCVRGGVPRDEALRAITLRPAQMLGLADRLGSIEPGKCANIVALTGDPLDFSSWVEHAWIDGVHAYDRSRDHRLQRLLQAGSAGDDESGDDAPAAERTDGSAGAAPAPAAPAPGQRPGRRERIVE